MRPKCLSAASASAAAVFSSATSPSTATALPPAASISRTTPSASALFDAHIDHDRRAGLCERQRDGAADIAPGAGDDGDFAGKFLVVGHRS